jgi:hypothetical protein
MIRSRTKYTPRKTRRSAEGIRESIRRALAQDVWRGKPVRTPVRKVI